MGPLGSPSKSLKLSCALFLAQPNSGGHGDIAAVIGMYMKDISGLQYYFSFLYISLQISDYVLENCFFVVNEAKIFHNAA